jgi:hypothetical protein
MLYRQIAIRAFGTPFENWAFRRGPQREISRMHPAGSGKTRLFPFAGH